MSKRISAGVEPRGIQLYSAICHSSGKSQRETNTVAMLRRLSSHVRTLESRAHKRRIGSQGPWLKTLDTTAGQLARNAHPLAQFLADLEPSEHVPVDLFAHDRRSCSWRAQLNFSVSFPDFKELASALLTLCVSSDRSFGSCGPQHLCSMRYGNGKCVV